MAVLPEPFYGVQQVVDRIPSEECISLRKQNKKKKKKKKVYKKAGSTDMPYRY